MSERGGPITVDPRAPLDGTGIQNLRDALRRVGEVATAAAIRTGEVFQVWGNQIQIGTAIQDGTGYGNLSNNFYTTAAGTVTPVAMRWRETELDRTYIRNWNTWTNTNTSTASLYTANNLTWTSYTELPREYDEIWGKWSVKDHEIPEIRRFATEEARRLRLQRDEELRRQRDELQRRREEASRRRLAAQPLLVHARDRAEELLMMTLTPAEKVYMAENDGQVMVVGGDTGDLYTVDTQYHGVHGNIRKVDEHGCVLAILCVAPRMEHTDEHGDRYAMPLADGFVGQILSIKFNEQELLARANLSHVRSCRQPNVPILGRRTQVA